MVNLDDLNYPSADTTHYNYKKDEIKQGARYEDSTVANIKTRICKGCEEPFNWPFKVGNAMTNNTPDGVQHNVSDGASSGYCSMHCFIQADGIREQETLNRDTDSILKIAIKNWFGLKVLFNSPSLFWKKD